MIIRNFYDAAFLIQEGYRVSTIDENEEGTTQWHFNAGEELIQKDLEDFHNNSILQSYVKNGVCKLRRFNRNYWRNRKRVNKITPSVSIEL